MSLLAIKHLYPSKASELLWQVDVVHGDFPADKLCIRCKGIWDTGASDSGVVTGVVNALGLRRLDQPPRPVNTANGVFLSHAYEACLSLSADYAPLKMTVWELPTGDMDVLIGMDIIGLGRFEVDSTSGRTMLTFEI